MSYPPSAEPVWLFGYGSLIHHIDFPILEQQRASIQSWRRRFWQGSHDHRGTQSAPGRVVTLEPAPGERCDGIALKIEPLVFTHLDHREKNGYERYPVRISLARGAEVDGVVYIAPAGNFAWLGDDDIHLMAAQIAASEGPSGRNSDYLLDLAQALRELETHDAHVFELAELVLRQSRQSGS